MDVVETLVARSKTGDVEAFTELVKRFQAMAFGYACATIRDIHLAEDATQNALLIAYRNLESLREPAKFGSWLRGVVRFECLRLMRSMRQIPVASLEPGEQIDRAAGPAELVEQADSLSRAIATLNVLPDKERVIAQLFYVQQRSQRDIAQFLDLPVSTVNNRLRSARNHLRAGEIHLMTNDSGTHGMRRDFANGIGEVLRANGTIVDARFGSTNRPQLLTTVEIDGEHETVFPAFVAQYLDDDVVRLVTTGGQLTATSVRPGMNVTDRKTPVSTPLDAPAIRDIIASTRHTRTSADRIETGIKVVDLFAPIPEAGAVAIVGDMNVGKMVLVDELFHRLRSKACSATILVFIHTPDEIDVVQQLEYRSNGSIHAIVLPVADASPEALESVLRSVPTVIVLDSEMARRNLYPAIDPRASRSASIRADDEGILTRARAELGPDSAVSPRADLIRNYLTQPFYIAEPFTNRPGLTVPYETSIDDLRQILGGEIDAIRPETLWMTGSLADRERSLG